MKKYFTTAISYVNGKPHLGHAYEAVLTDVLTRYNKLYGHDSIMLTGVDEHGQKVYDVAVENNMDPLAYCDSLIPDFTNLLEKAYVDYKIFFRTTAEFHKKMFKRFCKNYITKAIFTKIIMRVTIVLHVKLFLQKKTLLTVSVPNVAERQPS